MTDLDFTAEEEAVWQEGRAAKAHDLGPGSLPMAYRENWRSVFWAMGYSENDNDSDS